MTDANVSTDPESTASDAQAPDAVAPVTPPAPDPAEEQRPGGLRALLMRAIRPVQLVKSLRDLPRSYPDQAPIWRDRAIVLGLAMLALLPMLGAFGLWDPWETHYGEVGRQITERNDWISTWWGSHWRNGQGGQEGTFFFSKPIFLMWLMALGLEVFGFSEWGIRLGVCIIAITACLMAYSMGERVWSRRVGFIMAGVLGTSPFFFFLSRQAQTDMPFVGNMTIGLCFFIIAIFGRHRARPITRRALLASLGLIGAVTIPQIVLITTGLRRWRQSDHVSAVEAFFYWGPTQAVIYGLILVAFTALTLASRKRTEGMVAMYGFYVFVAFATLSKGLLGFALPGAFIFFYLLLTGHWKRLKDMELARGIPLFIAVAFPWYVAMLVRHGNAFYQRFFIHDHFKRLATGVHQIDSGSFEHYIKWMFYGLWPWGSFLPAAFARVLVRRPSRRFASDAQQATIFILIWLIFTFSLFTLASTKFHHYIFPAIPACAFVIGLLLDDLVSAWRQRHARRPLAWVLYLSAVCFFALIAWDLVADPQHLKNLCTYKYDRKWDATWTPGFQVWIGSISGIGAVGIALLGSAKLKARRVGLGVLGASAVAMLVFCLDVYMPGISSTWSQKGVWDAYYNACTRTEGPPGHDTKKRYCAEQALSYKLNWRGETYYTQNEVIPIRKDPEFDHFLSQNGDTPFYAIMEYSRWSGGFKRKLPARLKGKACAVYEDNIKFVLVRVPCDGQNAKPAAAAPVQKP